MAKLTAEERAKRALDYSQPFPGDKTERWGVPSDLKDMVEPEGMPTTRTIDAAGRIVKEIHEAEKVAREEEREACIKIISNAIANCGDYELDDIAIGVLQSMRRAIRVRKKERQ